MHKTRNHDQVWLQSILNAANAICVNYICKNEFFIKALNLLYVYRRSTHGNKSIYIIKASLN